MLVLLCIAPGLYAGATQIEQAVTGEAACVDCHQQQHDRWQQSDHAKAMALPTVNSVVANFNNQKVSHYGQKARFYMVGHQYFASISYDEKVTDYEIKYTFGHFPLQQYLVETGQGKLQVLPFAWDARDKEQGGQRWYHNYSNEEIRPEDRFDLVKQHKTHLLWTVQTQLENNHHLMYAA